MMRTTKGEFLHPLVNMEAEEDNTYKGRWHHSSASGRDQSDGSISDSLGVSYDVKLSRGQKNVQVAKTSPRVSAANEQSDEWSAGCIQVVDACTGICNLNSHCGQCDRRRRTN